MKLIRTKIIFFVFVIATLSDFFMSLMVYYKQPHFNETNPIYLLTGNFWMVLVAKLVILFLVWLLIFKRYKGLHIIGRYFITAVMVIFTVAQLIAVYNAKIVYDMPAVEVKEVPQEARQEYYSKQVVSPILKMYAWLIGIFIIWLMIEGEAWKKSEIKN